MVETRLDSDEVINPTAETLAYRDANDEKNYYIFGKALYFNNKCSYSLMMEDGLIPDLDRRVLSEEQLKQIYLGIADSASKIEHAIVANKFYTLAGMPEKVVDVKRRIKPTLRTIVDEVSYYAAIMIDGEDKTRELKDTFVARGLESHSKDYPALEKVMKGEYSFVEEVAKLKDNFSTLLNARKWRKKDAAAKFDARMKKFFELDGILNGKLSRDKFQDEDLALLYGSSLPDFKTYSKLKWQDMKNAAFCAGSAGGLGAVGVWMASAGAIVLSACCFIPSLIAVSATAHYVHKVYRRSKSKTYDEFFTKLEERAQKLDEAVEMYSQ